MPIALAKADLDLSRSSLRPADIRYQQRAGIVSSRLERSSDEEVAAVVGKPFLALGLERTTKTRKTARQTYPLIS